MVHGTDQKLYFGYGTAGAEANTANISTAGVYTQLSDERLKKDITPITHSLETINALDGVKYRWKDEKLHGKRVELGVIAQAVEKVAPEAVSTSPDGTKQVAYTMFIPHLINAVKEFYGYWFEDSKNIHRKIASVEAENSKLKEENAAIKSYLCEKDPQAAFCKSK
jgi:hypothetical protein